MQYALTEEQNAIVESIKSGEPIVKINAFAGTGKTSTLIEVSKYFYNKKVLYLAFNKSIQLEAQEKFESNVTVKTTHSLAYSSQYTFMKNATVKQSGYKTMEIKEMFNISYDIAQLALVIFNKYCNSATKTISITEEENSEAKSYAIKLFQKMVENEIEITHNFYLKLYQLKLLEGSIKQSYDLVLLDEAQDTNDVTLSIFYNINAKQKVLVGDRHQQIYSFRGGVNAIAKVDAKLFHLTKSFRFGQTIANRATMFLQTYKREKLSLKGLNTKGDSSFSSNEVYISRTNGKLIETISSLNEEGVFFKTVREPYLIFGLVLNIVNLYKGKTLDRGFTYLKKFILEFDRQDEQDNILDFLLTLAEEVEDVELYMGVKIAQRHLSDIYKLYRIAKNNYKSNSEAKVFLTTAHTSKGLEWDKVTILNDFGIIRNIAQYFLKSKQSKQVNYLDAFLENMVKPGKIDQKVIDELNLYYVATTRARILLHDKTEINEIGYSKDDINKKIHWTILELSA